MYLIITKSASLRPYTDDVATTSNAESDAAGELDPQLTEAAAPDLDADCVAQLLRTVDNGLRRVVEARPNGFNAVLNNENFQDQLSWGALSLAFCLVSHRACTSPFPVLCFWP